MPQDFDIAISYASEDDHIAGEIASKLKTEGIKVFYAGFYQNDLWGKDLSVSLEDIFRDRSRYCLMLVSQNYVKKFWTTKERQYALSRQIQESRPYILPVKLDDANVPGLSGVIHYLKYVNVDETVNSVLYVLNLQKSSNTVHKDLPSPSEISNQIKTNYSDKKITDIVNAYTSTKYEIEQIEDAISMIDSYQDESESNVLFLINKRRNKEITLHYLRVLFNEKTNDEIDIEDLVPDF